MCALARAGVKSMPAPAGPAAPTAVMVTVSLFAGVPTVILSPTAKPFTLRTLILVAPALASAERLVRLACVPTLRDRDGLDPMADAVDVQPDLVAGRDVGDGRHLDVGRAGGRVRRQVGLRARLADRGDRGHLVPLHVSCDGGVGGAVAEGDLLADREASRCW